MLAASTIMITGCAGTYSRSLECNNSIKKCPAKVQVEGILGSLLKPVTSMVANFTGFTYNDWTSCDPSEFYLEYSESSSITNLENRVINSNIFNGANLLGSKSFATKKLVTMYILNTQS